MKDPNPHILIVIEASASSPEAMMNWSQFLKWLQSEHIMKVGGKCLTKNLWQFRLPSELLPAHEFLNIVKDKGYTAKVFYSDNEISECGKLDS